MTVGSPPGSLPVGSEPTLLSVNSSREGTNPIQSPFGSLPIASQPTIYVGVPYAASSKFLGYTIVAPPGNAASASKFTGYTILDAPQSAVSVSKVVGYAILLTVPPPKRSRKPPFHLFQDEDEPPPIKQRELGVAAPPIATFTRQPHEFSPLDDDDIPPLRQRNLAAPIPIVSPVRIMKPPMDDEDLPPQKRRLLSVIKAIKRKLQTFTIT